VLAVNLRGAFLTVKAFLPGMLASGRGTIVNLVSTDAMPGLSAYIASKEGLVGFSRSLALEVGDRGVRVLAFGPGMVDTPGLREAGAALAPILGLPAEEFFKVSIHPAYDGPMPVADAGLAAAYLISEPADDYHGEVVDGYTVLERAGYIQPAVKRLAGSTTSSTAAPEPAPAVRPPGAPSASPKAVPGGAPDEREESPAPPLERAREGARDLSTYIAITQADFARLPAFVRPMTNMGLRRKSGQGLKEWKATAARLEALLFGAGGAAGAPGVPAGLEEELPRFLRSLEGLVEHVRGVPLEMARFTRDEETLRQVAEDSEEVERRLQALMRALRKLAREPR